MGLVYRAESRYTVDCKMVVQLPELMGVGISSGWPDTSVCLCKQYMYTVQNCTILYTMNTRLYIASLKTEPGYMPKHIAHAYRARVTLRARAKVTRISQAGSR
jgi:hypothetical protein